MTTTALSRFVHQARGRCGSPGDPQGGSHSLRKGSSALLLAWLLLVLPFAACASLGGPVAGSGPSVPFPPWVKLGSRAAADDGAADGVAMATDNRALFGLGEVRGIRNVALARSTADNRARAELARLLEGFMGQWLTMCPEASSAEPQHTDEGTGPADAQAGAQGRLTAAASQKNLEAQLLTWLIASNLAGVQIVEHFFHPHDGTVFSLARLDLSHIVQHLQVTSDISPTLKSCLTSHSDVAFDKVSQSKNH